MLTTKQILTRASEEFDLPYKTVEVIYNAWLKGLKDRIIHEEEPILYFSLPGITLYKNCNKQRNEYGKSISKEIVEARRSKKKAVDKIVESLLELNPKRIAKRSLYYYWNEPLEYYGFRRGHTLKELEAKQQELFDKVNTHDYTKKSNKYN